MKSDTVLFREISLFGLFLTEKIFPIMPISWIMWEGILE